MKVKKEIQKLTKDLKWKKKWNLIKSYNVLITIKNQEINLVQAALKILVYLNNFLKLLFVKKKVKVLIVGMKKIR